MQNSKPHNELNGSILVHAGGSQTQVPRKASQTRHSISSTAPHYLLLDGQPQINRKPIPQNDNSSKVSSASISSATCSHENLLLPTPPSGTRQHNTESFSQSSSATSTTTHSSGLQSISALCQYTKKNGTAKFFVT